MPLPATITKTFAVPQEDARLAQLPLEVRRDVLKKLREFSLVDLTGGLRAACVQVAARFPGRRGWSAKRLETQVGEYLRTNDWTVFVDRAKAGPRWWGNCAQTLPPLFIDYWQSLQCRNQGDRAKSAHVLLLNQWRRWRNGDTSSKIPGYTTPPPADEMTDIPAGWSYANLMRRCHRAGKFVRKNIQIGPRAAADERPLCRFSRVGMEPGEEVLWDDMWYNVLCGVTGQRKPHRLLTLHALDYYSACNIIQLFKPIVEDEFSQARVQIKERDMLFLEAHLLGSIGYRKKGSLWVQEGGTATTSKESQELIHQLTGEAVTFRIGKSTFKSDVPGLHDAAKKGNPRDKARIESHHALLQNRTADMLLFPGQTGRNSRIDKPEELTGREADASALMLAQKVLGPDRYEKLRLGVMRADEAILAISQVIGEINDRKEHELEGWAKCGHIVTEFHTSADSDQWFDIDTLLRLPPEDRERMTLALHANNLIRPRLMSPLEVWRRGQPGLVKLPAHACALILGQTAGREVPVRRGELNFAMPEVDAYEDVCYEAILRDGNGTEARLANDTKWMVRVNPLNSAEAFIYDSKDGYLGKCRRLQRAPHNKIEAMEREFGRVAHARAELVKEVKTLAADITAQAIADEKHNIAILGGAKNEKNESRDRALSIDAELYADVDKD